jgi:RHH-type proline utilization regulon transcriptional repressor/proline dehydrogenase/delta 1-pyrroline-5-carboxylate dehydrogenase
MNTLDTPAQMDTAHNDGGYITEFKEKSEFEQRINTAWRRAEPEAVAELAEAANISPDLDQKIYELAFDLAT